MTFENPFSLPRSQGQLNPCRWLGNFSPAEFHMRQSRQGRAVASNTQHIFCMHEHGNVYGYNGGLSVARKSLMGLHKTTCFCLFRLFVVYMVLRLAGSPFGARDSTNDVGFFGS